MTPASLSLGVDAVFSHIQSLRPDSSLLELEKVASLFTTDCIAYLRSMREILEPAIGREAIVDHLRELAKDQQLQKYRVIAQAVDEKSSRIFSEMENRYTIHDYSVDTFPETSIMTFDADGLISSFKLYSCRSQLVHLIQKATGIGPYSESYMMYGTISLR